MFVIVVFQIPSFPYTENQLRTPMPKTYLVTDSGSLSTNEEDAVSRAGVALVSTEWVVQCIVNEKILDPEESPKYKP